MTITVCARSIISNPYELPPSEAAAELSQSFGFEPVDPAVKAGKVRAVFDKVAPRYDLMNDLMSAGVHRLWKEALVDWLAPRQGKNYLDLAGGTGDIATRILRRIDGNATMLLTDINYAMLSIGRDRALDSGYFSAMHVVTADAQKLPLGDGSIDYCTIRFRYAQCDAYRSGAGGDPPGFGARRPLFMPGILPLDHRGTATAL